MANLEGLEEISLSSNDYDKVLELIVEAYIPREPVSVALRASDEEIIPLFKSVLPHTLRSGASIGLKDTFSEKIIAVMLNVVIDSPDFDLFNEGLGSEKADLYAKLMKDFCRDVNVFEDGQFKKSLELLQLCVHPNYGKRGIATKLIEMSETKGRGMGCDVATIQAVNFITDHMARKLGYQERARIDMNERKKENGEPMVDMDLMRAYGTTHLTYLTKAL